MVLKLIAETKEENRLLDGLGALLTDLGVGVTQYRMDEAYAPVFWSARELSHLYSSRFDLTHEEAAALLEELEPTLHMAMANAGARLIDKTLDHNLMEIRRWADLKDPEESEEYL